jgi:membrane-associated phospholipid phosphatase
VKIVLQPTITIPMKNIFFGLFLLFSLRVNAQTVDTTKKKLGDTIKKDLLTAPDTVKLLHSKPWALVPGFAAITYGALTFAVHPMRRVDYFIHSETEKTGANFHSTAESYFQFAPIAMVYGLNLVGVTGKNTFIDRTALLALSAGILGATGYATKHLSHRLRPNGDDYLSFPSGHTATAFMGAEFLAQEFSKRSPVYTIIGYSFATTTGVFRLYNRDHWFSDVVAGAGYGILSTKVSYLVYPYIRDWITHKNRSGKTTLIMPTYQEGVPGFYIAMDL